MAMAVVCSEVKEDYFLSTIGAVFDDNDEDDDVGERTNQGLETGGDLPDMGIARGSREKFTKPRFLFIL